MDRLATFLAYIERMHPKSIDLGLERIQQVYRNLNLSLSALIITVGGTNGKGSTVALLESILFAAGYRVAAYYSPHLLKFNERIRLNGIDVDDTSLLDAFERVEQARQAIPLTFFEFTTLAAFLIFETFSPDFIVLEVGLGGRLDAVNLLDPKISVITSISLDHLEYLGSTREAIAHEKAGIFRKNCPVVCGDRDPPSSLLKQAAQLSCPISIQGRDFFMKLNGGGGDFYGENSYKQLKLPHFYPDNIATVLQLISLLQKEYAIAEEAIRQGLLTARLFGRFQFLSQNWIVDVAHNPDSARVLAEKIQAVEATPSWHAIVGMLKEKDHENTLRPLIPYIKTWHAIDLAGERATEAKDLAHQLEKLTKAPIFVYTEADSAIEAVEAVMSENERVIVFGSFLTVAVVMERKREKLCT